MIFRAFGKGRLRALFDALAEHHEVVGPVEEGRTPAGESLFAFRPVSAFDALRLDYPSTSLSAKPFYLPPGELLATFRPEGDGWTKAVTAGADRVRVLFGLHPCDVNALNRLDRVLLSPHYPMPWYGDRRRNLFVVAVGCSPRPSCFCRSLGTDTATRGFDLLLTDLGDEWFAEILTPSAFRLVEGLPSREVTEEDHVRYRRAVEARERAFRARVDTTDLGKILDMEFRSPVWERWGDRCLGCGTCAAVCPTCYCHGVEEEVSLDLSSAAKVRRLHSCNLVDFAEVAGGLNFRPGRAVRLKYRYYHKHRGFVEAFEESLCVGCGRCGDACLAGITVPDVVASVRGEEA